MSRFCTRLRRAAVIAAISGIPAVAASQNPPDRGALEARIAAHASKGELQQALSAYDAYVTAVKKADVELLKPIAVAELRRLAKTYPNDRILSPGAFERLARSGDAAARQALETAAAASSTSPLAVEAMASLARLGDEKAAQRLGGLLASGSVETKVLAIQAIEDANARSQASAVAARLNDADVSVRRTAAHAVGVLQYRGAVPQLRALMERDAPIVQMSAAPALKRLGDTSADAHVAKMLAGDSPEMRLEAARAYPRSARAPWLDRVKALRSDRDGLARVRAAEVLACCDPAVSRAILDEALADPLPPMRVEAARVYELEDLADAAIARRLLADSFDHVRLHGAGAVLRLIAKRAATK